MKCLSLLGSLGLAQALYQQPLYSTYTFNPLEHLAGIAPYFEPADPARDPSPPQGCQVTRAAYLVRHAAINANDFDYESYLEPFSSKLKNTTVDWSKIPQLSFLSKWSAPKFQEEEQLTRTGKLEAAQLGVQLSYRYHDLRLPKKVWASSAERTVVSAESFIRGIEMEEDEISLVTIDEGKETGANSLTPYKSCPNYSGAAGSKKSSQYVKKYTTPILTRLRSMAPAFNWTSEDVVGMFEWCGYETVVRGQSPFCSLDLFRSDEWLQFEYGQDIMYHYNTGYGSPYSGAIGFPWVNATLNLLDTPASNDTQDLYVSFTHRELPPTVLVALGLFNNSELTGSNNINATMPTDRINYHRQWISSYILPFLTNVAIEKMNCSAADGFQNATDPTFYRVLVNRSPQTLPDCFDGPLESCSAAGMKKFLGERGQSIGDFSTACDVGYKNTTNVLSIFSQDLQGETVGKRRSLARR
ncbi:phosphoglycerate mutase-like protein [Dissoconium aciculare CBS 342.82]|uniref:Phosphoglycerate mutase-like protein n=1 Tax=Dissoconium aciculare CBS 342.82 TaxID=1314786 RepID=A0A6J3M3F2_9PEZI|nr:phosphoglycerate mutase-like protein [Dissoconium aciculare CBS 342.82]KAF1822428.1 phosphoglycerate mutase-like protein [Dissoconium aciculare CBS 342.82]